MSKKVQFIIWLVVAIIIAILACCAIYSNVRMKTEGNIHPEVTIEFENYGTVKLELYPEYAPNTVTNFIKLAETGYYNDKVVYGKDDLCLYMGRTSEGEVEDPTTETIEYETLEPFSYSIKGEFISNGFNQNTLRTEKGSIVLIRNNYTTYFPSLYKESYNSGNAQLGIVMSDDAAILNGVYATFGKVTEGLDVLENIYAIDDIVVETEEDEEGNMVEVDNESGIKEFRTYPVIKSISVDKKGIDFGMPEIMEMFDYNEFINQYISASQSY